MPEPADEITELKELRTDAWRWQMPEPADEITEFKQLRTSSDSVRLDMFQWIRKGCSFHLRKELSTRRSP